MMIFTAKFTRKKAALAVILAGLVVGLVIVLAGLPGESNPSNPGGASGQVSDNSGRVAFLEAYGWQVESEPVETLQLLLPEQLEGAWAAYSDLQQRQGFDLSPYCGKRVERFTYTVTNYPEVPDGVQANLFLCGDRLVGGDIIATGENGFQTVLAFPEK